MDDKKHYDNIHKWIKRHFRKALECIFCFSAKAKRFEWALKKGYEYERDINNYIQLCPSCHRKYDIVSPMPQSVRDKMSAAKKGKPIGLGKILSEAHKKAISNAQVKRMNEADIYLAVKMYKEGISMRKIGVSFNLSHGTVSKYIKKEIEQL